jgi:hypothetical protein
MRPGTGGRAQQSGLAPTTPFERDLAIIKGLQTELSGALADELKRDSQRKPPSALMRAMGVLSMQLSETKSHLDHMDTANTLVNGPPVRGAPKRTASPPQQDVLRVQRSLSFVARAEAQAAVDAMGQGSESENWAPDVQDSDTMKQLCKQLGQLTAVGFSSCGNTIRGWGKFISGLARARDAPMEHLRQLRVDVQRNAEQVHARDGTCAVLYR